MPLHPSAPAASGRAKAASRRSRLPEAAAGDDWLPWDAEPKSVARNTNPAVAANHTRRQRLPMLGRRRTSKLESWTSASAGDEPAPPNPWCRAAASKSTAGDTAGLQPRGVAPSLDIRNLGLSTERLN
mmetsp:Transcript_77025/g.200583  ORF Transcript_77025/g.200583 Transcript_77025/m.200583 type:complete len:128 (+) Transcript_77025:31-414(+)